MRLYVAGLVAVLIGMPLAEEAKAAGVSIVDAAIDLGVAIADAASGS